MFYGDLYRPVNGIIKAGYTDGQSFKVATRVNPNLKINVDGAKKKDVAGLFTWEQSTLKNGTNYTASGSLDLDGNISVHGKAKTGDVVYGGAFALATDPTSKDNKGKTFVQYAQKGYTFEASAEKKLGVAASLDTSATFNYEGVTVGANANLIVHPLPKNQAEILNNYNLGLRYSDKNYHFAVLAENKLKNVKIGFAQDVDANLSIGLNVEQDLTQPLKKPVFTVGNTYRIDADSSVRAKIDNNGEIAAAYRVNVNNRLTATVSAATNVFDRTKGARTGVLLEFSA